LSAALARGHCIEEIEEVSLVVGNAVEPFCKTKKAVALLKSLCAYHDVIKELDVMDWWTVKCQHTLT
jgi:hypothetical protein